MSPESIFQLLRTARFGAYAADVNQTILFWNRGAQRILGHRSRQVVGRRCYEVMATLSPGGLTPVCMEGCPSMQRVREGRAPTPIQVRMLCASGQRKLVSLTPMVVSGILDGAPMLVHLFFDSTDDAQSNIGAAGTVQDALREIEDTTLPDNLAAEESLEDGPALTRRELEVLRLVALGRESRQIAEELGIRYHTVLNHIRNSRRKFRSRTKLGAVLAAIRRGLIQPP